MSKPHYGAAQYRSARRIVTAGKIIFGGAAVFVAAAFVAGFYAWTHDG